MARIRTIKPAFFSSLSNADLPIPTRVTWIGLWTYVDDKGRGVDDARLVKAAIWPLDDNYSTKKVENDLARLEKAGKIGRYIVDGQRYLAVVKWREHQRIDKPQRSILPPAPWEEDSRNVPGTLPPNDGKIPGTMPPKDGGEVEGKGREGKGSGREGNLDRSSSSLDRVGGEGAEEEELRDRVTTAARLVAERRLAARTGEPLTNATAWLRTVKAEVLTDHGAELHEMAAQGRHPKAMADRIMPAAVSPYPVAGEAREAPFDEAEDERGRLVAVPRRTG